MKINIFFKYLQFTDLISNNSVFYLKQEDNQGYENKTVQFLI